MSEQVVVMAGIADGDKDKGVEAGTGEGLLREPSGTSSREPSAGSSIGLNEIHTNQHNREEILLQSTLANELRAVLALCLQLNTLTLYA